MPPQSTYDFLKKNALPFALGAGAVTLYNYLTTEEAATVEAQAPPVVQEAPAAVVPAMPAGAAKGKKIGVVCHGSRGDTQPLVAIAVGFQKLGFGIVMYAGEENRDFAKTYGFEFVPLASTKDLYDDKEWLKKLSSLDPQETVEAMCDVLKASLKPDAIAIRDSLAADPNIMCLLGSTNALTLMITFNFKLNIPSVCVFFQPHAPTTAYLSPMFDSKAEDLVDLPVEARPIACEQFLRGWHGMLYNYVYEPWEVMVGSQQQVGHFYDTFDGDAMMDLVRGTHPTVHTVYCASETLLGGRPADYNKEVVLCGYPTLDNTEDPNNPMVGVSPELRAFLEAGEAPVYIGFGSMCALDNLTILRLSLGALAKTKKRGVILAGWAALAPDMLDGAEDKELKKYADSGRVLFQKSLPHDWLFPKCCAVCHHGGAGTTHSALLSGTPHITIPFYFDQTFFADRTVDLGSGLRLPSMVTCNVDDLAQAINTASSSKNMKQAAVKVREELLKEHAVSKVVGSVLQYVVQYDPIAAEKTFIIGEGKRRADAAAAAAEASK
mmetsp:Transcript_42119/g.51121  ORF Transcript_42119/g.51121 Transcript_42119/m.51121 type:complete len:550 (-) Transcript_42119:477-2126(-)|eukprot:CAMPEP_0197853052 /NCGR_PEP_ID=MMETSP1438-20131217/21976_1 /TAXON_ID=1461541 /ORGANISM="Pterosperma sp., Strain CCMP1384" /LENGTH=549 /DNA_ID=CAMNT_0043467323 /DNA_START=59 /DNA_END=1708 /DNA_ORIENTATION=+